MTTWFWSLQPPPPQVIVPDSIHDSQSCISVHICLITEQCEPLKLNLLIHVFNAREQMYQSIVVCVLFLKCRLLTLYYTNRQVLMRRRGYDWDTASHPVSIEGSGSWSAHGHQSLHAPTTLI